MRLSEIIIGLVILSTVVWLGFYGYQYLVKIDSAPVDTNLVRISSPKSNSVITSPLTVTGEARGFWFFEASFPVIILDANGNELGVVPAQAQGEWMTTDFVPFWAVVNFRPSPTATGFLVLKKDNPSGLPENDQKLTYPIRFR